MKNWRTKEGATIPIVKMDDTHLVNSMKMLERHAEGWNIGEAVLAMALAQWEPSAKALAAINKAASRVVPVLPPSYFALRSEAERRGIELAPAKGRKAATVGELQRVGRMFNFDD